MVYCRICQTGEIKIETKDGIRYFSCLKCKTKFKSTYSGPDTLAYNMSFKEYQYTQYLEEIEYADEITLGKSISSRINYKLEQ